MTGNAAEAVEGTEFVVSAMPSQHCRALFEKLSLHLRPEMLVVSATKGLGAIDTPANDGSGLCGHWRQMPGWGVERP